MIAQKVLAEAADVDEQTLARSAAELQARTFGSRARRRALRSETRRLILDLFRIGLRPVTIRLVLRDLHPELTRHFVYWQVKVVLQKATGPSQRVTFADLIGRAWSQTPSKVNRKETVNSAIEIGGAANVGRGSGT